MTEKKLIWDLPVRLFHWLLVVALITLYVTSELGTDYMQLHIYAGYFTIALVIFRLIWGLVGTKHARFVSFVPTPRKLTLYASGKFEPAGHNPLGGLMVIILLLTVLIQALSGLFVSDDVLFSGPYNGVFSADLDKLMTRIHHQVFNVIVALVVLHIVAVLFYLIKKKVNLINPMLSGYKTDQNIKQDDVISHSKLIVALVVATVVVAFVYWLVVLNVPIVEEELYF